MGRKAAANGVELSWGSGAFAGSQFQKWGSDLRHLLPPDFSAWCIHADECMKTPSAARADRDDRDRNLSQGLDPEILRNFVTLY